MNCQRFLLGAALLLTGAAAFAQQSTLIIHVDAPCTLTVNGTAQGRLAANAAKAVAVHGGDQRIECTTVNGVTIQKVVQADPGMQKVVELSPGAATRFSDTGGTVTDRDTGLVWSKTDNGRDIDWNGASRYCGSLSPGTWALPTMSELGGLYDSLGNLTTPCGQWTCKVSPLFKLSGPSFWSSETADSSHAWFTALVAGNGGLLGVSKSENDRALCVRRRS